jgi:hypothetical protein
MGPCAEVAPLHASAVTRPNLVTERVARQTAFTTEASMVTMQSRRNDFDFAGRDQGSSDERLRQT